MFEKLSTQELEEKIKQLEASIAQSTALIETNAQIVAGNQKQIEGLHGVPDSKEKKREFRLAKEEAEKIVAEQEQAKTTVEEQLREARNLLEQKELQAAASHPEEADRQEVGAEADPERSSTQQRKKPTASPVTLFSADPATLALQQLIEMPSMFDPLQFTPDNLLPKDYLFPNMAPALNFLLMQLFKEAIVQTCFICIGSKSHTHDETPTRVYLSASHESLLKYSHTINSLVTIAASEMFKCCRSSTGMTETSALRVACQGMTLAVIEQLDASKINSSVFKRFLMLLPDLFTLADKFNLYSVNSELLCKLSLPELIFHPTNCYILYMLFDSFACQLSKDTAAISLERLFAGKNNIRNHDVHLSDPTKETAKYSDLQIHTLQLLASTSKQNTEATAKKKGGENSDALTDFSASFVNLASAGLSAFCSTVVKTLGVDPGGNFSILCSRLQEHLQSAATQECSPITASLAPKEATRP